MSDLLIPGQGTGSLRDAPRPMIIADNVHVNFRVYASGKKMTARESLTSLRSLRGGRDLTTVPALRGVSFTATEGESIGVVGHNGSGKSTLFRTISGLMPPSEGSVFARERPVLLGVNAALVPELSGENNIRLGLLAMGFSPEEAAARVGEIADFAELNDFIYYPMRTYSSGMAARLKFAIASAKAHSILLIDEALAVGDRRFRAKSEQRINELRGSAGLVMIVSHSAGSLKGACERVLWVHKGELIADGPTNDVINEYVAWTKNPGASAVGAASPTRPRTKNSPANPGPRTTAAVSAPSGEKPAPTTNSVALPAAADGPRAIARRERFRRDTVKRRRRNLLFMLLTGAAILLAVAAGAIIGTLASFGDESAATDAVQPAPEPLSTEESEAPAIASFSSNTAVVECASEEDETEVQLSWKIDNATNVALAAGEREIDALDSPLRAALPGQASGYAVAFACATEATVYTLTAENAVGTRVNAPITVSRLLPPEPEPEPVPPVRPVTPTQPDPEPTVPAPEPTIPAPEPTIPAPEPTVPAPEPTTDPGAGTDTGSGTEPSPTPEQTPGA